MAKVLTESFEWSKGIDGLPKNRLIKIVAKTTAPTVHPEDPMFPVRLFAEMELMKNARSLIGRPIGLNHQQMPIYGAYVVDADYNEIEKQLEAIGLVPDEFIQKIMAGLIKQPSIEYTWRETRQTDKGTEFIGLGITRVDLVEGLQAGDPNAVVSLFEASEKRGVLAGEVTPLEKKLGEPFAGYPNFAACVAANQDKENPEAYCAEIQRKTEATKPADATKTEVPPPPLTPTPPPAEPRIKELEDAVVRLTEQNKQLEASRASAIADARRASKRELADKISAVIPQNIMVRKNYPNGAFIRTSREIKKVLSDDPELAK